VARYRVRLEPALAPLKLRRDSYNFQDQNAQDIVTELLPTTRSCVSHSM
jgi:type VI secretion system secreted protein VgrG